ncbi:MAG TPA: HAMP domain-containing sensor histidine kinase [Flavobacteriales bacterium]|nr:HAMP domain-containing sensor histidine kinase [Flavobacteriales bacterium]
MNLYSRKQTWKIVLFLIAICIAASSLVYTSYLIRKIKEDERRRINVWSSVLKNQVNQLYLTNRLFDKVRLEEEKKVKLWARAMEEFSKELPDYTFAQEVTSTTTLPLILTDDKGHYNTAVNLDFNEDSIAAAYAKHMPNEKKELMREKVHKIFLDSIENLKKKWIIRHKPLPIKYGSRIVSFVYYKESKLFDELQHRKDSITASFNNELINNAALVPVIFYDKKRDTILATNMDKKKIGKNLKAKLEEMEAQNTPIVVNINDDYSGMIFYEDSPVLTQIKLFPYVQTIIVGIFLLITYLIFNTFKAAEQNQVWAGMAKETAHQLGTPLSSLMAWNEILKANNTDPSITSEIDKDIQRLNTVTDRFSKIGSDPKLEKIDLTALLDRFIAYLKPRVSKNVIINADMIPLNVFVNGNAPLLEWVFENLSKNAVDAMEAKGSLTFVVTKSDAHVTIDITDTGKGIPSNKFKTVFKPGYSTKQRGWGLGLSLVKRIVEEYHDGKIYVANSEVGKGTTFRVVLNKV